MTFSRPGSLRAVVVCLLCSFPVFSQQRQQSPPPQQQPPPQPPPPKPVEQSKPAEQKKNNPFEAVPESTDQPQPPKPQAPKLEAPKPATEEAKPNQPIENVIESIEFRGARRVPQDTLRATDLHQERRPVRPEQLHRDFMALWNTGRFDDIRMEREPGRTGWIITFVVTERRVIRSIKYDGMKSITISEILDRFKERKVGLSVGIAVRSQQGPARPRGPAGIPGRARAPVRHRGAGDPARFRPSSLEVTFKVDEGPKVKVGKINFDGQRRTFSDLLLIRGR